MNGEQRKTRIFLLATLALGATFLGVQVYEYIHLITVEGFTPSGSLFGAGFYTVTGFHGFHVFIGLMLVCLADPPGVHRAGSRRTTICGSRSSACTGTSSTSSGSCCSPIIYLL